MLANEPLKCGAKRKFVVLKLGDVAKLAEWVQKDLEMILVEIEENRLAEGKSTDNEYLVINTDEPYAQEVIEILKKNGHWG